MGYRIEGTLDSSYLSCVEGVSDWNPKAAPPQEETLEVSTADDQHGASSSNTGKW